jgi:4-amino-4-deoxy-L-arabinose transferase-like glycosyltransferase
MLSGMSYTGLKIASVVVSLGALFATYALARRLMNQRFALLSVAVAGVSSWLLIFSRLGGSPIIVPLLTSCALWLVVRFAQTGRTVDLAACAIVSALGLYAYVPSFVLPAVSLATLACLRWSGYAIRRVDLLRFAAISVPVVLPFFWFVYQDPANFTTGHIGSKLWTDGDSLTAFVRNTTAALLAFHVRGDEIFRSNPRSAPHLDVLSGVLFLAGIIFWLRPQRRRTASALLVPFVLLQVPSILVLGRPREVPSAGRTLGVAPIAYILVASGVWWSFELLVRSGRRRLAAVVVSFMVAVLAVLNLKRYFGDYIGGLPYHDTSIGREIATYADALPKGTHVYVVGCCWESSMPELPFIKLVAEGAENIQGVEPQGLTCESLRALKTPAVLVWSFHRALPAAELEACRERLPAAQHVSQGGWPVFFAAPLRITSDDPGVLPDRRPFR